jgi:hypothetical protein
MMTVHEELEAIREQNDGILRAEDVLEYAKNPETALHKRFTWDDDKAAQQYRLAQARAIIRVNVIVPDATLTPIRAYVSLYADRQQPGGGYRHLSDVLTHVDRRKQLLTQALKEAKLWREKYKNLAELAPVFGAIDEVKPEGLPSIPEPKALNLVA